MTRILIADDHAVVRAGLRQFLEEDRSIREIGEAATGNETLEQLRAKPWDLLILDIYMPDRSGLDILKQVQASHPKTKILIISGLPERQYALNALKAGASGYLAKDSAADELLKAVRAVLRGRRYVSPTLAELLVSDLNHDSEARVPDLLQAGIGTYGFGNCGRVVSIREDCEHVSQPRFGENEFLHQRGSDVVRVSKRDDSIRGRL
jgi:DNA-binding NarL/FixJ family response regulator